MPLSPHTHRPPAVLTALLAVLALLGVSMPAARADVPTPITAPSERVVVQGDTGRVILDLITPQESYSAGDTISLQYRFESTVDDVQHVSVTSETVSGAERCSWRNLPGQATGKYNCNVTPRPTQLVTEADAAAGRAEIRTVWTTTDPETGEETGRMVHVKAIAVMAGGPVTQAGLAVTMQRTDTLGTPVHEGQLLTFSFTNTNTGSVTLTAFPRSANLGGVAVTPESGNCRWADLRPGQSATCSSGWHLVTADDVASGSFTPTSLWQATADRAGTQVLIDDMVVTDEPVTTAPGAPPFREGEATTLAVAGSFGFTCHRIPALTQAPNGWLLASWDGRPGSCADAPNANSIVQRISTDGGATWGPLQVIAAGRTAAPKFGYSDPSYLVDRETGTIFNFFVKSFNQGWGGSVAGTDPADRNVLHAAVMASHDNGLTWSEPRVITADITPEEEWTSRFAASGEGIQLRYGPQAGRLLQQYTVRDAGVMRAVSVYSDDHGATWRAGQPVGSGMDENKVVELSTGEVMLNSRSSDSTLARKVAISGDGGVTYGPVSVDHTLIDPRNNASIIRAFPDAEQGSARARMLVFTNAASTSGRVNGTVRLSFDDGHTWSASKVFEPGSMSYSTLTPLTTPGTYGLLYEGAGNAIRYMQISLDWLGALPVAAAGAGDPVVHRGRTSLTVSLSNLGDADLAGLTVAPELPAGWTLHEVTPAVVDIPAGETVEAEVSVDVAGSADPADHEVGVSVSDGERSATGSVPAELRLRPFENASQPVSVTLALDLPAQPGQSPANLLDSDPATIWHTPWADTASLPLDIDLIVADGPVDLASLTVTPRQSGSNGRIRGYEVLVGDDPSSLVSVAAGTLPSTSDPSVIPLMGSGDLVRLRVLSTYGDQADHWVSTAELSVTRLIADSRPGTRR